MRSHRLKDDATSVSLFPFLAVLLCTMGALIVLLIVIARQARISAAQPVEIEKSAPTSPDENERKALLQRSENLKTKRAQIAKQLRARQDYLGTIEARHRKLQEELGKLQARYHTATLLSQASDDQKKQAEKDLQRLRNDVAQAKKTLDAIEQDADAQRPTYSVIPYQGSRNTRRRPIYIECRADKVVLHPEGLVLTEDDFLAPSDTGNPLSAALRATRQYIAEQARTAGEENPYPLVLIRPDGTDAYYAVRRAMKGWGPEFGYEMIDADWKMEYPAADPNLAQIQHRAIEEARLRQKAIVDSMRRKMMRHTYVDAPGRGGLIEEGTGNDLSRGFGMTAGGEGTSRRTGADEPTRPFDDPSESRDLGRTAGRPGGGNENRSRRRGDSSIAGTDRPPRESHRTGSGGGYRNGTNAQGQTSRSGGRQGGGAASRSGAGSLSASQSLAKSRGKNWGMRTVMRSSIGITRPVRVSCYNDRLVIRSDASTQRGKVITLGPDARQKIDEFVKATWQQTESWGIAGKGMYWKPVLSFEVEEGGEHRFRELSALLSDSGLEVRRAERRPNSRSRPSHSRQPLYEASRHKPGGER